MSKKIDQPKRETKLERLERENAELRRQIAEKDATILYLKGAAKGGAGELYQEVIRLQQENRTLKEHLPMWVIDPNGIAKDNPIRIQRQNGRWQHTVVGVTIAYRDSDDPEYSVFQAEGMYIGDRESAQAEISMRVSDIITPMPPLDCIPKTPKGFESVTQYLIRSILDLVRAQSEDEAIEIRRNMFNNHVWPKLKATDYEGGKDDARRTFHGYLERTINNWHKSQEFYFLRYLKGVEEQQNK